MTQEQLKTIAYLNQAFYFDKCHNCSYKYTPVCKKCTYQKNEEKEAK